jgi:hypothetical protein
MDSQIKSNRVGEYCSIRVDSVILDKDEGGDDDDNDDDDGTVARVDGRLSDADEEEKDDEDAEIEAVPADTVDDTVSIFSCISF